MDLRVTILGSGRVCHVCAKIAAMAHSVRQSDSPAPGFFRRLIVRWLRAATPPAARDRPVLDLHGLGVKDALAATERFLAEAQAAGVGEVRIVYGKGRGSPGGRGVLREVIPRWLGGDGRRYVDAAVPETDARGQDGAIHVSVRAGNRSASTSST